MYLELPVIDQLYIQNKALALTASIFNCHIDDVNSHVKGN